VLNEDDMSEMVERVMMAIAAQDSLGTADYEAMARAAIEAMHVSDEDGLGMDDQEIINAYIDAALRQA
jgi:hypothetical protein